MSINQQQFKILHDQCRERLLNSMTTVVRNRDTAEDVTAAALATAWQNRNQFRGESSLYTWCYSIALNEARNRLRRNQGVSLESIDRPDSKELTEPDMLAPALERAECRLRGRSIFRTLRNASQHSEQNPPRKRSGKHGAHALPLSRQQYG